MKILLFSHLASITGGAEQCLLEYVDVLVSQGHKCKVVMPQKGPMAGVLSEKKIPWIVVGYGWAIQPHRKVHPHRILTSTGNSLVKIFQEVEKFKPDLIVTNTSIIPWGLYAGRAFNIPTMLLVHEILSDKDPSLKVVPNYSSYGKILDTNTDYVIYNSEFVKKEFADILKTPRTSKSILYPLPPLDKPKIDRLFRENHINKKLTIAIFGALSPRKNQMEVLRATKFLYDRGVKNFTVDLYGDTTANQSYTKEIRKFIRENSLTGSIKVKGYATNVYEKMNEYNVVLNTATYEPFGRTIVEGQLFGRIVITNNTGGGLELVNDSKTGLVYESGKPDQLAEKIEWIINNQPEALTLGNNAKDEQSKKYITDSRYDALLEAVRYFDNGKHEVGPNNIFDPIMSLFQYNHQLNNRYRHLYRLTHNRVTYTIRNAGVEALSKAKKAIRKFI